MTETTTERPSVEEAFGPAGKQVVDMANQLIAKANAEAHWLRDNSRDPQEVIDALQSGETKDKDIAPLLKKKEELDKQLADLEAQVFMLAEKKAKAQLEKETNQDEVNSHQTAYKENAKAVRETEKAMVTMFGEGILDYLEDQVSYRSRSNRPAGTGPKRYRGFEVKVNGTIAQKKMGKSQELKSSFGAAADVIGNISLEDVTKGYTDAVGTTEADKFPVGKTISYEVKDSEGKTYKIEATKVS